MDVAYPKKYKVCPRCTCKGRIPCDRCNGKGELIERNAWDMGTNSPAWAYTPCPKCSDPGQLRGTGRGSFECPTCEGRGYVEREQRLKASNAEQIREVGSPVPGNESSYDVLKDGFYAARKEALDSLDGQALSPYWRALRRERILQIEFTVLAGIDLVTVIKVSPPDPYEEAKLKELGLEPEKVDASNYPDDESQFVREFQAEKEMLRTFYFAAARGIL